MGLERFLEFRGGVDGADGDGATAIATAGATIGGGDFRVVSEAGIVDVSFVGTAFEETVSVDALFADTVFAGMDFADTFFVDVFCVGTTAGLVVESGVRGTGVVKDEFIYVSFRGDLGGFPGVFPLMTPVTFFHFCRILDMPEELPSFLELLLLPIWVFAIVFGSTMLLIRHGRRSLPCLVL